MKRTPEIQADNFSPGGAVSADAPVQIAPDDRDPVVLSTPVDELPPLLAGHLTPALQARAESFYRSVAGIFERWASYRFSRAQPSRPSLVSLTQSAVNG